MAEASKESMPKLGFYIEDVDNGSEDMDNEATQSIDPTKSQSKRTEDEVDSKNPSRTQRQPMKSRSDCWKHFEKFKDPKSGRKSAKCIYCEKSYFCDGPINGTSNLNRHFRVCLKNPDNVASKSKQTELSFQPSLSGAGDNIEHVGTLSTWKFDQQACREAIARWVIKEELPFRILETEGYKEMMAICCPRLKVPSRWTVSRDCAQIYLDEKSKLKTYLKTHGQRISITTDTWTSVQRINYMCITAHFIDDDWHLQKKVINFCEIESHKGQQIGMSIENCLLDWEINKLFTVTVDNASSNDVAVSYLKKKVMNWGVAVYSCQFIHMRCMAHIINLVVQDGLKEVGPSVKRVRAAIKYIRFSPSRLKRFRDCVQKEKIQGKNSLCLDCPTRWNSTYMMLTTAEKFEKAFDRYKEVDRNYELELSGLDDDDGVPTFDDWENVRKISVMLKMFYNLTMRISGSKYVTSNTLWAEVSGVLGALMYWINGRDEQLKAMAIKMKQKFDKYWGDPTKMNKIIWFAPVFDPREKFEVINISLNEIYGNAKGTEIFNDVKESFALLFKDYQKMHDSQDSVSDSLNESQKHIDDVSEMGKSPSNYAYEPPTGIFYEMLKKQRGDGNRPKRSKLDLYLDEALVDPVKGFDILNWWKLNSARFPILSIMARDILAIPVSTVASESTFSTGGRVLDPYRSSLSPQVVESLICTQDWIRGSDHPLFVAESIGDAERLDKEFEALGITSSCSNLID